MLCFASVEEEEPVRFSKRRQSSAIDRLHDQDIYVTTRMRMIMLRVCFCDVHFGFNNDSGGTILVRLGIITAIVGGSDNNYSSHCSWIVYGSYLFSFSSILFVFLYIYKHAHKIATS